MNNDKYDLHDEDYSVQGWDAIMAADMQIINDQMPTRILVILGEAVVPYEPLYLNTADNKWYKAQANGTKQPCLGLAVETGDEDADEVIGSDTLNYTCKKRHVSDSTNKPITGADWATYWTQVGSSGVAWVTDTVYLVNEIRIHRMGEITNAGWAWASLGEPIYLDPNTAGALTQTKPSENIQVIGYALTATKMVTTIEFVRGVSQWNISRGGTVLSPAGAVNIIVWRAPFACIVVAVKGYRIGGTGATINARRNGANNHLASDLSLTNADVWMDGGVVQNVAYAAGDKLEIMVVTVAGSPSQVAVQIDFEV